MESTHLALDGRLLHLPVHRCSRHSSNSLLDHIDGSASRLHGTFVRYASTLTSNFVAIVNSTIFVTVLSPVLFNATVALLLAMFALVLLSTGFVRQTDCSDRCALNSLASALGHSLTNVHAVHTSGNFRGRGRTRSHAFVVIARRLAAIYGTRVVCILGGKRIVKRKGRSRLLGAIPLRCVLTGGSLRHSWGRWGERSL